MCDLTNTILNSESVKFISYLIFDGKIDDAECIDVTLGGSFLGYPLFYFINLQNFPKIYCSQIGRFEVGMSVPLFICNYPPVIMPPTGSISADYSADYLRLKKGYFGTFTDFNLKQKSLHLSKGI